MSQLGKPLTAKILAKEWTVSVRHSLYGKNGKWYHHLNDFPAALFDFNGFVIFPTKASYVESPYLKHGVELNVRGAGISEMPGYVRMRKTK